jgi:hypothetical protein
MGVPTGQIQLPTTKNISELYRRDKSDPPLSPPPRNREAFSLIIKIIQTLMEKSPIFKKGGALSHSLILEGSTVNEE